MRNILASSLFIRFLNAAAGWVDSQWRKSRFAAAFLHEKTRDTYGQSVFYRLFELIHRLINAVFRALRLDRLLNGSVFKRAFFWCALAACLAPLLPTMYVLALCAMGFLSLFLCFACDRERKLVSSPADVFIYLYAFIYLVCTVTSASSGAMQGGLLTCAFVLFAVVLQNAVTNERQTDILIYLLVSAGMVVSLYGMLQYVVGAEGAEAWLDKDMFDSLSTRVYSTLENPNVLAEYLLLIIPLAAVGVVTSKTSTGKTFSAIATVCMLLAMLLTLSRGGWLGLVLSIAVFLILIDRRFIVIGVICALAAVLVLPDSVINRFTSIGNLTDGSTSYRVAIWMGTLSMLSDYWFCGIGPGTAAFNSVYPSYSYNAATAQHSHNLYLQITCETGIAGIVIFVVLLFVFFKTTCSALARTQDKTAKFRLIAVISGMLGFLLQGMSDFSFYNYRVMLLFWMYIALGMILSRKKATLPADGPS